VAVASAGVFVTALHNHAVTGSYTTLPYVYAMRILGVPQAPIWMKEVPMPGNLSPRQKTNYEWQRDYRRAYRPDLQTLRDRMTEIIQLCGRLRIVVPLVIASMILLRDFWTFAFAVASAFALLAGMIYPYFWVHYYGPFLPMVFLLLLRGMQALWSMVSMRSKALRSSMAVLGVGIVVLSALDHYQPPDPKVDYGRSIVETALSRTGQKHLVFVEYGPQYNRNKEWIYNAADIDGAPVVWARQLGPEQDAALRRYFADRHVWLVTPNRTPLLQPWPGVSQRAVGSQ
jgi:hypothetical protein